ncbi:MAG: NAD(P)H-dependent oxidoreductase [Bacteroidales bacterium]|jgi:chromate reductase|nr:NAD(P)H-dependent oxidoreductase [Bacteroidales bacterium]
METIKTLVLVGGISKNSLNQRLFNEIEKHYHGALAFTQFAIEKLPYYSQDIDNGTLPIVNEFKAVIKNSQAVLLITPEYNRSFPGVLKNALDWGSRPYEQNTWGGKPAAIMGASVGKLGTFAAQGQLRAVCSFLNMHVMNQPEFYGTAQTLLDETGLIDKALPFVQKYLDSFEQWVRQHISMVGSKQ